MTDQPTPKLPPAAKRPPVTQSSAPEALDEPLRYTREELPEWLGVAPHIVQGALANERKQSFTVEEARDAVKAFYAHEDESEGAQPDGEEG